MNPAKTEELEIQTSNLLEASFIIEAANNPLRQQLLCLLNEEEKLTLAVICRKMQLELAVCIQHMSILRKAGLVLALREGNQMFYAVNNQKIYLLYACAEALLPGYR
jgi:DNA-binding transcriptional ArsR family regulator